MSAVAAEPAIAVASDAAALMRAAGDGRFEFSRSTGSAALAMLTMTRTGDVAARLVALMNGTAPYAGSPTPLFLDQECHAVRADIDDSGVCGVTLYSRRTGRDPDGPAFPLFGVAKRVGKDAAEAHATYYDVRGLDPPAITSALSAFDPALPGVESDLFNRFGRCGWFQYVVLRPDGRASYIVATPDQRRSMALAENIAAHPGKVRPLVQALAPLGYVAMSPGAATTFRFYARPQSCTRPEHTLGKLLRC